jgi:hypothetical protein
VLEGQVRELEALNEVLPIGDLARGQIDAEEGGLGERLGHRDQVAAGRGAQFEDAGALDRGWA